MNDVEKRQTRPEKETIHSGHFMVSHFEAEAQDDFDDLVTVPDEDEKQNVQKVTAAATYTVPGAMIPYTPDKEESIQHQQLSIEISLTKLFKCMTLAYRQKLTSPKWNRFKGIKLRWKDKIRLNNVIWRCWHMQFIKKQNTLVCQFASPLDVDTHVKPEATILEGKYWKRRAEAVIAEYKKWRKFHIMRLLGKGDTSVQDTISDMDTVESFSQCSDLAGNMLTDEDYLNFMTDTLFSTITSHQPFAFPDCREIARGASLADFIQPSLGPLQPNLDDFMDTLEPLQDLLTPRLLPPVPEESALTSEDSMYRVSVDTYSPQSFMSSSQGNTAVTMPTSQMSLHGTSNNTQMMSMAEQTIKNEQQMGMYDNNRLFSQSELQNNMMNAQEMLSPYQPISYEQQNTSQSDLQMHNVYVGKSSRLQFVNTPKIVGQSEPYKYNTGVVPPSQTAPETVSLLQQPIQNSKYASTIVIQGRGGYGREKPRQRVSHYSGQVQNNQYQGYGQAIGQSGPPVSPQGYESRSVSSRQTSPQMQYLQPSPVDSYKAKSASSTVNPRSFKMPSPPLVPATSAPMSSVASPSAGAVSRVNKEQFRSHSLPLGSQLNPDWTVSAPAPAQPAQHEVSVPKHNARARESNPGGIRIRSRSTSGGVVDGGAGGASGAGGPSGASGAGGAPGPARRPPPLHSVASEPTLPQASVMLAQLLSAQHSQSLYKLNSCEEGAGSDPTKSPSRRTQPSPIGSDVMSPHHSLSPPTSPSGAGGGAGSPRAGSPREPRRTHLHAEQKRRYNIKNGFDTLQALIPHLNTNPAAKISKAAMLQKGAEYIKQLKAERNQIKEEMENLRQQIECLNNSITNCHSLLPATGAPVSRARSGRLREMFSRHVANRTMHNWKYWLVKKFSRICGTSGMLKISKIGLQLTRCLFTDELLNQLTWKGMKGCTKVPFMNYIKTRNMFFKIIHLADNCCSAMDSDAFLQNSAIKHSGQRMKRNSSEVKIINLKKKKIETDKTATENEDPSSNNLKTIIIHTSDKEILDEEINEGLQDGIDDKENKIDDTPDTKNRSIIASKTVTVLSDVKINNKTIDSKHETKMMNFSVVSAALVESFSACVSCSSAADLVRTTLLWAEQHCSLVEMRPAVLNSLRVLCTTTDILTSPERLPDEARAAVAASAGVKTEPT